MHKSCLSLRYEGLAFVGEGMPPEGRLGWAPGWAAPPGYIQAPGERPGPVPHPSAMPCLPRTAVGSAAGPSLATSQRWLAAWLVSWGEKLAACSTGRLGDPTGRSTWIQIAQKESKEDFRLVERCPHCAKYTQRCFAFPVPCLPGLLPCHPNLPGTGRCKIKDLLQVHPLLCKPRGERT